MEKPTSSKSANSGLPPGPGENIPAIPSNAGLENRGFSIVRVMSLVLIVGVVSATAYGVWTLMQKPKVLVPFSGSVMFDGKPVNRGGLATMRLDDQLDSAVGAFDAEGRFTLETNGEPGAYVGRHKVVISSNTLTMPPRALIPSIYGSMSTTPLIINVSENAAENHRDFVLEGTLAAPSPPADASKENPVQPPPPDENVPQPQASDVPEKQPR